MICAVVLAAGLGRRMGAVKPLLDIEGRPSLERVLATIDQAGVPFTAVVLGHAAREIQARVDLRGRQIVLNPAPERGMASSLALALSALPADAEGALVFHADMPFLRATTVGAVLRAAAGAEAVAPSWNGTRGFPVFFRRSQWAELQTTLRGDAGGREFLRRHPERLVIVDVTDPGCVRDIDRPGDVAPREGTACCAMFE